MTDNLFEGNQTTELEEMLSALKVQMNELAEANKEAVEASKKIEALDAAAREAYRIAIDANRKNKFAIDAQLRETKSNMLRIKSETEKIERTIEQARRMENLEREFENVSDQWLSYNAGAPWREFAMDHQIEAARKIAYSRSAILADIMGLGKTLSAIITVDMIAARQQKEEIENTQSNGYHAYSELNADICNGCLKIRDHEGDYRGTGYRDLHFGHYNIRTVHRVAGKKILYLSPPTLVRNVEREVKRWAPHRANGLLVLSGMNKIQRNTLLDVIPMMNSAFVILNYEAWRKDLSLIDRIIAAGFDTLICDEAHIVKETTTISYRGVRDIVRGYRADDRGVRISNGFPIEYVVLMTGSPILNKPQDLYSLLSLVDKEQFPPTPTGKSDYLHMYCQKDMYTNHWTFSSGGMRTLTNKIGNRFIRRTHKDAGIELPKQGIQEHEIDIDKEMYPDQAKAREEMRTQAMIMLNPEKGEALVAQAMLAVRTRLRQIETWPNGIIYTDDAGLSRNINVNECQKIDYIISPTGDDGLLPEVCPEQRTIVFSQFVEPLKEIARRSAAAGIRAVLLTGQTPQSVREEINKNFDRSMGETPKWDVVLCNYKVGGLGLNFTAATQTIILDEEWNPGKRDQGYMRNWRIGQTEESTVHVIMMKKTVDTWMHAIMVEKENMVDGFNTEVSTNEFFRALKDGEI